MTNLTNAKDAIIANSELLIKRLAELDERLGIEALINKKNPNTARLYEERESILNFLVEMNWMDQEFGFICDVMCKKYDFYS